MNGKEIFECIQKNLRPDRIPFVPTIYEHSAKLINKTPSIVAKDEKLIVEAQLKAYEIYRHDLVSVGVDIYNVEIEALGANVNYHDNEDIPSVSDVLVTCNQDIKELTIPDPEKSGRMPIYLNATEKINEFIGNEVIVNGSIVGPFTLAAILRGFENFIMDMICDIEFAVKLLNFSEEVLVKYGKAFIKRGVGLSINESWIAPPLLSPSLYSCEVMKVEKKLIKELKEAGAKNIALICGGDTTPIAAEMVKTGTSLLMADYNTDQEYYKNLCYKNNISLRASIQSKSLEQDSEEDLKKQVKRVIDICSDYNKFIFGCGIVSYNTSPQKVILLKKIVQELDPRKNKIY